jgi:hypothetical protein
MTQPNWSNPSTGLHFLTTPRGALKVQRFSQGWIVHRDGEQLSWFQKKLPVIFSRLQDAKTAALVHMHDYHDERFVDGTRWWS